VCDSASSACVIRPCTECNAAQICYTDPVTAEQSCSRPECSSDAQCSGGAQCFNGICRTGGCATRRDCPQGEVCGLDGTCTDPPETCSSDEDCAVGLRCDTEESLCGTPTLCDDVTCEMGFICDPRLGECIADSCSGQDPAMCVGNGRSIVWDNDACSCVECIDVSDCPNLGDVCNDNGQCSPCPTPCDSGTPGTCQGKDGSYCVDGCCLECIGHTDCVNQVCVNGACVDFPKCAASPDLCPSGTTCIEDECKADTSTGECDPRDADSCPFGQFCKPGTGGNAQCAPIGGVDGCGLCGGDCTCDNGLTCEGFACRGCTSTIDADCPTEYPACFGGACFPVGF